MLLIKTDRCAIYLLKTKTTNEHYMNLLISLESFGKPFPGQKQIQEKNNCLLISSTKIKHYFTVNHNWTETVLYVYCINLLTALNTIMFEFCIYFHTEYHYLISLNSE